MPDIDAAMLEMGEALGVTWCSLQERDQSVRIPQNGLQTVPLSLNPPFWWGGRVRGGGGGGLGCWVPNWGLWACRGVGVEGVVGGLVGGVRAAGCGGNALLWVSGHDRDGA